MKLIVSLLITLSIGFSGSFFTRPEIEGWYAGLSKPWFNPPNWLFGPVWTTLYVMMGIALWLVWKSQAAIQVKRTAILLFALQLLLNFSWSLIFFNLHQIGWALVEIVLLWIFILLTILWFAKIDKKAAWLLVPYISWVSFATILNFYIWKLNG